VIPYKFRKIFALMLCLIFVFATIELWLTALRIIIVGGSLAVLWAALTYESPININRK